MILKEQIRDICEAADKNPSTPDAKIDFAAKGLSLIALLENEHVSVTDEDLLALLPSCRKLALQAFVSVLLNVLEEKS